MKTALLANGLPLGGLAALAGLAARDLDAYDRLVQEDGFVEWLTVALLLPATGLCLVGARRWWRARRRVPWFYAGLAAFCVFFAGEEISWGQRLLGYVPPPYFLEHNPQQETNLHNLFKHVLRTKYILMAIVGVWGMALPLLDRLARPAARALDRLGVVVPPVALAPTHLAILLLLVVYPWKLAGEVAECMFALVLFATTVARVARRPTMSLGAGVFAAVVAASLVPLGVAAAADDSLVAQARREAGWLRDDWHRQAQERRRPPSRPGTHLRIYTWVRGRGHARFRDGAFARAGDDDRHRFFLDPWGSPYWIRHVRTGDGERVYVYSFGPNRRRESTERGLAGDDVGVAWSE